MPLLIKRNVAGASAGAFIVLGLGALSTGGCGKNLADDCMVLRVCDGTGGQGGGATGGAGNGGSGGEGLGGATSTGGTSNEGGSTSGGVEGGEAGMAGASGGGGDGCDTTLSPGVESCLVSERHAVFVAPTGSEKAAGTRGAPLKTLGEAVELAATSGKIVIACSGTYDEAVSITTGARVYGGFACPDDAVLEPWSYQTGTRAVVASAAGVALEVENVADAVVIEDFEFDALDASKAGESSIAATVANSSNVVLRRVKLVAGNGAAGSDGQNGERGQDGATAGPAQGGTGASCGDAAPPDQDGGLWSSPSRCSSIGGRGGAAYKNGDGAPGASGDPRTNVTPAGLDNGGPKGAVGATPPNSSTPGGDGSPGSPGNVGATGTAASAVGAFSASGYAPALSGGDGKPGFPGQGGGGGGASSAAVTSGCIGASGGAGGMGGCGGTGGTGGGSGGASLALLGFDSSITLESCELKASDGGAGGKGGNGGTGGAGKDGADGGLATNDGAIKHAGKGGKGGDGGYGGPGAGGSGGPSYALVYHGTRPTYDGATSLEFGKGGKAGPGGTASAVTGTVTAPSGSAGLSQKTFVAK